jgi:hypothetical protein
MMFCTENSHQSRKLNYHFTLRNLVKHKYVHDIMQIVWDVTKTIHLKIHVIIFQSVIN